MGAEGLLNYSFYWSQHKGVAQMNDPPIQRGWNVLILPSIKKCIIYGFEVLFMGCSDRRHAHILLPGTAQYIQVLKMLYLLSDSNRYSGVELRPWTFQWDLTLHLLIWTVSHINRSLHNWYGKRLDWPWAILIPSKSWTRPLMFDMQLDILVLPQQLFLSKRDCCILVPLIDIYVFFFHFSFSFFICHGKSPLITWQMWTLLLLLHVLFYLLKKTIMRKH